MGAEANHWTLELEKKYIHLFETIDDPESPMDGQAIRGIEVGDGWERIITRLLERLEWIRTNNTGKNDVCHSIKIFQFKQKFGDLRAYVRVNASVDFIQNQVDNAIAFAEGQCQLTCETCGRVGNPDGSPLTQTKGWISWVCNPCKEKRK